MKQFKISSSCPECAVHIENKSFSRSIQFRDVLSKLFRRILKHNSGSVEGQRMDLGVKGVEYLLQQATVPHCQEKSRQPLRQHHVIHVLGD